MSYLVQTRYSYSSLTSEQRDRLRSLVPDDRLTSPSIPSNGHASSPKVPTNFPDTQPSRLAAEVRMQSSLLAYFRERDFNGISVTLTFRAYPPPDYFTVDVAEATVAELLRRLDKFAHGRGRRQRKNLKTIAIREGGTRSDAPVRLHYHLKIEVPLGMNPENFGKKVEHYWTKLKWASLDQNRFDTRCDDGWLTYILKRRSKLDYADAFDCINTRVPPYPNAECSGGDWP